MRVVKTRECTEVYFGTPSVDSAVAFKLRSTTLEMDSRPGMFHSRAIPKEEAAEMLERLYQGCLDKSTKRKRAPKPASDGVDSAFRDKVNEKRRFIAQVLHNNPTWPITRVMQYTRSDFATVKKVSRDLKYSQEPTVFQYNNLKPQEAVDELHETLEKAHTDYRMITDIKRMHAQFSRKAIGRQLKRLGIKYLMYPKAAEEAQVRAA